MRINFLTIAHALLTLGGHAHGQKRKGVVIMGVTIPPYIVIEGSKGEWGNHSFQILYGPFLVTIIYPTFF